MQFTSERNMSVHLKIDLNNNFNTNSTYTKFLEVTMDNTLSRNSHIDLLMKKLSTACYIDRNSKTYMSALSLKVIYCVFFTRFWIIFWGNSSHSSIIFRTQKKANGIMEGCKNRVLCIIVLRNYKNFTFDITICYHY